MWTSILLMLVTPCNWTGVALDANNFTGPIPDDISELTRLRFFNITKNLFSDGFPAGFANLTKLEIVGLRNLKKLFLGYFNDIPKELGNLRNLQSLFLYGNFLSGSLPPELGSLSNLLSLDVSSNQLSGPIPASFGGLANVTLISLFRNFLEGEIPAALGDLPALELTGTLPPDLCRGGRLTNLIVMDNRLIGPFFNLRNLVGTVPEAVGGLAALQTLQAADNQLTGLSRLDLSKNDLSLTQVDFSYNNLSGPVPTLGEADERDAPASNGTGRGAGAAKGNPDLLAWLVGALFSAALVVLRKEGKIRPWKLTPFQRLEFTANELVECLSDENIIGRGGAGTVYKGEMASGEMVAVKRLACGRGTSSHDHGFSAEIRTLGKIRHRNIVRLLGFCTNNEMNLLVYEYMPNGSLGEFLHGKKSGVLDWNMRYSIAVQAAHGLCYLHHDCSPLIVHRDVKSNNILLDSNLEAHVADFGLAKLFQDSGKSESMSSIAGSYGYIAPEYAYTLKVNEKSDIYSFGVVLMELLTGKRPIEPEFGDGVDIVQWVRTKIQTKEGVMEILDPRVGGVTVPLQEVMLVLRVALLCSGDHPIDRPTMRDVVQMLSDVRPTVRTGSMDSRELKPQQILLTDDLLTF
ncbi:hypothetical protein AXG93_291s1020 [Marchantia polymorpha subsp. ruderalis]|uniref:non-specific serine/threonine protein kinase n=1 Tax=Marchantia polymorpha subsp. ruderalis TaxID=1480154 RepID=A0A176VHL5_MARPO|nr:hypothetical protein AXG93_291s1020 [Marchantia polymorpha subsp. ruderalis]